MIKEFAEERDLIEELKDALEGEYDCDFHHFFIEMVDDYGGEGMGNRAYNVYKITNKDTGEMEHLQVNLWYDSYDGTSWDCWWEDSYYVTKKTVMVEKWVKNEKSN